MTTATSMNSPMLDSLASRIISEVGTFFASIAVSPSYSIDDFPYEKGQNYLYVLYSANGMPLYAGVMLESAAKRDQHRLIKEIQGFGANGFVETFRVLELGSEELTRQFERLVQALFNGALPLRTHAQLLPDAEQVEPTPVESAPQPVQRRRGRPRRNAAAPTETTVEAPAQRRRSRPRKSEAPVEVSAETPAKRRRGRPRKNEAATAESATEAPAPRRRGRPRKSETPAEAPAKRRRGRPRKNAALAPETGNATAPAKRRGRPRKNAATEQTSTTPAKRRGRPRKNESAAPAGTAPAKKRRGRPRKSENAGA